MKASSWLVKNSEPYQNIEINHDWEVKDYVCSEVPPAEGSDKNKVNEDDADSDTFSEVDHSEAIQGNTDSLLDQADMNLENVVSFAPG